MNAEDHRQLIDAVGASPLAMVVSNPRLPDNPIEVANPAFCNLTGYSEVEILGRNCRFLAGALTQFAATEQIRASIHARNEPSMTYEPRGQSTSLAGIALQISHTI